MCLNVYVPTQLQDWFCKKENYFLSPKLINTTLHTKFEKETKNGLHGCWIWLMYSIKDN